jgi:hydrogenase nickel incorporation protein HypA/HybF
MHELSITQSILEQALSEAKKHKAKRIKKIKLQIGAGTAIVADCVQFYFNTMKTDTIARNSILDIEMIPVKLRCPKCKKEYKDLEITCDCKKGVEIVSGQEMIVEYIDVE